MKRRELIKQMSYIMGGTLMASSMTGILSGCQADPSIDWTPEFFSPKEGLLIGEIAERIIPKTDTPGAKDALVDRFIDAMVAKVFSAEERTKFKAGLSKFDKDCKVAQGSGFVDLDDEKRDAFLTVISAEEGTKKDPTFFERIRELTMLGFFTSEIGATQVLQYKAVPGGFEGCVPLDEVGVTWAT